MKPSSPPPWCGTPASSPCGCAPPGCGVRAHAQTSASDVVTAAELAAEELVVARLGSERPVDGIVGEEGSEREGTSGRTWVLDPVDGTFNFVQGLDWWCFAIAQTDGGVLTLGAVHHPHDDHTWVGGRDRPTTRDGVEVPRRAMSNPATGSITSWPEARWMLSAPGSTPASKGTVSTR